MSKKDVSDQWHLAADFSVLPVLVTRRVADDIRFDDPSLTKQEFLADTDIKVLMDRFMQTGQRQVAIAPQYGDTTILPDSFQDAMDIVAYTHEAFDALPSSLRNAFSNDPAEYLAALQTEEGRAFIVEGGVDLPERYFPPSPTLPPTAGVDSLKQPSEPSIPPAKQSSAPSDEGASKETP